MTRPRIYVAGPITLGDVAGNLHTGIEVSLFLLETGYSVYSPFALTAFAIEKHGAPPAVGSPGYENWLHNDLAWIEQCHALLRLPGQSAGADREVAHALAHGLFVFYAVADLLRALPIGRN